MGIDGSRGFIVDIGLAQFKQTSVTVERQLNRFIVVSGMIALFSNIKFAGYNGIINDIPMQTEVGQYGWYKYLAVAHHCSYCRTVVRD
ncbi:hypothetical protein XNC3_2680014 [Xenorhabdus nematophila F1]|nr:hypothetical protein XNC3_2680014 [Xenorhabdus nematophila F1]CEE90646.1 hypothetical protein XNA1_1670014 [Xenorhabdus nematophila str. Anatoliense]CEE92959.1 hypothetical protein XNA1_3210014 [Xenorhabdus nematophila str. Anatoliense]CEF28864.1 hypothetical protein XNW1_1420014 [Xenorhabdus nematophila str. Websteri]CEF33401.1 hypothetical protein XNW1_4740014 [Xenorhabdus nematophila str. Websteri]